MVSATKQNPTNLVGIKSYYFETRLVAFDQVEIDATKSYCFSRNWPGWMPGPLFDHVFEGVKFFSFLAFGTNIVQHAL